MPDKASIYSSCLGMTHRIVASASGLNFTSGMRETQSRKVSGRLQITLRRRATFVLGSTVAAKVAHLQGSLPARP